MGYRIVVGFDDGHVVFEDFVGREELFKALHTILEGKDVVYVEIEVWRP